MATVLSHNSYGKAAVRFAKIIRRPNYHDFKEVAVNVTLEGDFEEVYTKGDNRKVLPTDTMKNTVYALARDHALDSIEAYGRTLAQHFLQNNPQVARVRLELSEKLWQRVLVTEAGKAAAPHPHTFIGAGHEKGTSVITSTRAAETIEAGIENLLILKTTASGFENYIKDRYTTLKETNDRILASDVNALWRYEKTEVDFNRARRTIRQAILDKFAQHYSASVQQTIYLLGEAVLEKCSEVAEVHFVMPNKHYIPFDLERFGVENRNEIFVPTEEPFGRIAGTVRRSPA